MKFSYKLIISCMLSSSVIFSLGASLMIYQNHEHLLSTTLEEKTNAHMLQTFSLESKLIQDTKSFETAYGEDENSMSQKATYYVKQYASLAQPPTTFYILQNEQENLIYTNAPQAILNDILENQTKQALWKRNDQTYTISSSTLLVANRTYHFYSISNITAIFKERTRQYQSFLLIDGCMLIISFLIVYLISTYLTKPIQRLHDASIRIASGHYKERTNIHTNDEIGALSISFDEMAEATEATIEELKQVAAAKEEFMGSFSHEIKTPMTAIIGFADMLRTYDCDEQTKQEAASYIYSESKRLEHLSSTLMELLSLSNTQPAFTSVDIHDLQEQLIKHYQGRNQVDQLQLQLTPAFLYGNEALLFTMLRNLIDNAFKATETKEAIELIGTLEHDLYLLCVKDHGIGMSDEVIAKVEQPFYMADQSRSRSHGGAGLGLSIVKRICELHHTTLSISSTQNQGTTIYIRLEVAQDETH